MWRLMSVIGLVFLLVATVRADGPLILGDPAPKLNVKEFVKGEPVKTLDKGKVYVVEFWATWCLPCQESIPHLTQLAKQHKDVVFIGVSVLEEDAANVKPFVQKMGGKMDYRVAVDSVPAGKKAADGVMNKTWMAAAGQFIIPTAFIINKDGVIAWIGRPTNMDKALDQIVAGTWDLPAETARVKRMQAVRRAVAGRPADVATALTGIDTMLENHPAQRDKTAQALNDVAWAVVDPEHVKTKKPPPNQVQAAVAIAAKAVELTQSKTARMLDTLGQAHFVNGDLAEAIAAQEKAVKLAPNNKESKERLAEFKKAKENGDK